MGLEAALYARYLGYNVDLYERGRVADNVRHWGHVRMFTPFGHNRSTLGLGALKAQDPHWVPPDDDATLTGREFAERYLVPLAQSDLIVDGLHEQTEVLAIGRAGLLKGQLADDEQRGEHDFRILLRAIEDQGHVREYFATADAVIDTTGTYGRHNWLGPDGVPAIGELSAAAEIEYRLPDVLGADHDRYASRNILLVGDGDSAAASLVNLAELAATTPDTWITWVTRGHADESLPGPVPVLQDDPLPERRRVALQANGLAVGDANHITHFGGTAVESIVWHPDLERFVVELVGKHPGQLEFDRAIANVGYRSTDELFAELHVERCGRSGAPRTLAGEQGHGVITAEPDYYVLGAKSGGRNEPFQIAQGLEQVRAVFAIIGDRADLDLYANVVLDGS